MIGDNFSIFRTNCAIACGARVFMLRRLLQMSRGENGVRNSRKFYAFGPQLNTFMSVGVCLRRYFRRLKLLKFERLSKTVSNFKTPTRTMQMSYLYASEFPFKNFCTLSKQAATKRHYRKQIKHCYEKLANELDSGVESFQDKLYA